ncbi:MAG: hypothetical protein HY548_01080, partial [Elusimicrobia bacterium]|nr:hypothetical protein [Elusimicrobiota bacterium]
MGNELESQSPFIDFGLHRDELGGLKIRYWRDVVTELHDVCERGFRIMH